jgi:hypothetical protein
MFDAKKPRQLIVLCSALIGSLVTAVTVAVATLPATAISNTEKLEQQVPASLASRNRGSRSTQQASVRLEELSDVPRYFNYRNINDKVRDQRFDLYNRNVRTLQQLPSRGQSLSIRAEDSQMQRLLKQQLNDAIEIYQIIGQLLDAGKLDKLNNKSDFFLTLPAIQIAIVETDLATNLTDQRLTNRVGLVISESWERDARALERAGLGLRSDILKASYYRGYCEIQRRKLAKESLNSTAVRASQPQQKRPLTLSEIAPISLQGVEPIEALPIENRERAQRFRRAVTQRINPLIGQYNANIKLLKLIPRRQALEVRPEDRDLQEIQRQQLDVAAEVNRLQGLFLAAGLLTNDRTDNPGERRVVSNPNPMHEIMLPAIQIAIADINLATNANDRRAAIETGMKIAQTWENKADFEEKDDLYKRMLLLTARYWKRYFEIQKLNDKFPN